MWSSHKILIAGCVLGAATWGGWEAAATRKAARSDSAVSSHRKVIFELAGSAWRGEGRLVGLHAPAPSRSKPVAFQRALAKTSRDLEALAEGGEQRGEAVADLAILDLLRRHPREAERRLRAAARLGPQNAKMQSDLAATYLHLAQEERRPSRLVEAFITAERAIQLDAMLPEARFNYALVTERLFLRTHARQAWRKYLLLDKSSEWTRIARRHWFALSRDGQRELWTSRRKELDNAALRGDHIAVAAAVWEFPQRARLYAQEELLGQWGRAQVGGDANAASRALTVARAIGAGLAHSPGGDLTVSDAVAAIDSTAPNFKERRSLAEAHASYAAGITAYRRGKAGAARFSASLSAFEAAGSPMLLWASFDLARCDYQAAEYGRVLARLRLLVDDADIERYPAIAARAQWTMGLAEAIQGRFERSLQAYFRALELARRCREGETVAAVNGLLAENFRLLGDSPRAWRHLQAALEASPNLQDSARLHVVFDEATLQAAENNSPRLALLYQTEALPLVHEVGNPPATVVAYYRRASLHEQLGEIAAASRDLEMSDLWLEQVEDEGARKSLRGDFVIAAARLARRRATPRDAVVLLDEAVAAYGATGYRHALPRLLLERARARAAAGDTGAAIQDLDAAIGLVEAVRAAAPAGDLRADYLNHVEEIFDEMVRLQVQVGATTVALDYAERGRARLLLDLVTSTGERGGRFKTAQALSTTQIQGALPSGVALVIYRVYDDLLLRWIVTSKATHLERTELSRSELASRITDFRRLILEGSPEVRSVALGMHELVLGRANEVLEESAALVFVPDDVLQLLPFTALRSPRSGRYLVESLVSSVSMSASLYVRSLERLQDLEGRPGGSTLLVGDPAFDAKRWPWLGRLSGAQKEVRRLASILPHSQVLIGSEATEAAVLRHARHAQLIHFASHTLVHREQPLRSGFVLAGESNHSGYLSATDLYSAGFDRAELVMLATCEAGAGRAWGGEGVASLARPFLALGVPAVIVSLWALDDDRSVGVVDDFYTNLAAGDPPAVALRHAQLRHAKGASSVRDWAGLELIGASRPGPIEPLGR